LTLFAATCINASSMSPAKSKSKAASYRVYPAVFVPCLLALGTLAIAFTLAPLAFIALPFIYLGSSSAAPNLSLSSGFLALIAVGAGLLVSFYQLEIGAAIFLGSGVSWVLSSFEQRLRAKPVPQRRNLD